MAEHKEMTVVEAGRKGGERVRELYGLEHFRAMGLKGGERTREKYRDTDHYRQIGQRGGQVTSERHGPEFYEEIGKKGGQRVRELIQRGLASE